MAGGTDLSRRRLSAAIFKIEQFIYHLDRVASGGFPHNDGKSALDDIRGVFERLREKLKAIPEETDDALVVQYFREVRDQVEVYTRILGIILRSTNLRNNFEIYHPLKRLSKLFLGEDVRLLISSEWEFIPFTYPMNIRDVPNLILVGSPATEAQNLLVTPLAGHEIGHSIWVRAALKKKFAPIIQTYVNDYLSTNPLDVDDPGTSDTLLPDVRKALIETSLNRKTEEAFCDLLGLKIFGTAYLYAFEYYMAPGRSRVSQDYPSDIVRLRLLRAFASRVGVSAPDDIFSQWETPSLQSGRRALFEIADKILVSFSDEVFETVEEVASSSDLPMIRVEVVQNIISCFDRFEPYGHQAEYAEIINALWISANKLDLRKAEKPKMLNALTEIALKTVEVSEVLYKQTKSEQRSGDA